MADTISLPIIHAPHNHHHHHRIDQPRTTPHLQWGFDKGLLPRIIHNKHRGRTLPTSRHMMYESPLNNAERAEMQNKSSISLGGIFPFRILPTIKDANTTDISSFEWSCTEAALYEARPPV